MSDPKARILIADDQADVLEALRLLLKGEDYETESVKSPQGVLAALEARDFDAILMDLNYTRDTTSGREGLDLLLEIKDLDSTLPVIVMTAWGSIEGAVEAMRRGARDYVEKPWDNNRLLATLRTHVELGRVIRESQLLETENRMLRSEGLPEMISESRAMQPVLHLIERMGPSEANVLVTGEHGTGKELVARRLHALSARARKALVIVNAGGLSEGVFESELFGHVKGAFTDAKTDRVGYFELADGGTLFLDEVGNMPPSQQAKLLRVLQTGEFQRVGSSKTRAVDVRVLSATNVDIGLEVVEGRFREDLLYRLNTVEIHVPALRERPDDVAVLALHFLRRQAVRYKKDVAEFDREALQALREYTWPGNVRELEHVVERAVLMAQGPRVRVQDLGLRGRVDGAERLEEMTLEEAERYLIQKALDRCQKNVSRAAEALGLSRSALYRRLQQYDIPTT
ncbi:MAG: sigma-54 dependent transcriptional regulator [Gemmatimonadota bacterium]